MNLENESERSVESRRSRSIPRTHFAPYRDDVSVDSDGPLWSGLVLPNMSPSSRRNSLNSYVPIWFSAHCNHSSRRNSINAESFRDEDQFSFSPVTSPRQSIGSNSNIVGTFRPAMEEMVDVNVSAHGRNLAVSVEEKQSLFRSALQKMGSKRATKEDAPLAERTASSFSYAKDDLPFETIPLTRKRRMMTGVCCALTVAFIVFLGVFFGIIKHGENPSRGQERENVNHEPVKQDTSTASTLSADACDFSGVYQPNVFLQCRCSGHLSIFSQEVIRNYNDLKANFLRDEIFPGYYSRIDSCDPQNLALAWLATDTFENPREMRDRYILALIYATLKGYDWKFQDNWLLSSSSHCTWYGVECNKHNRTVNLLLNDNNLSGPVPTELVFLDTLETLALGFNKIEGVLPRELGSLSNLQALRLSANLLIHSIPTEYGELVALRTLELNHNKLQGTIPTELMRLPNLDFIGLWENQLSGTIPSQIQNLKACREFKVSWNLLTGNLPTELGGMEKLIIWESAHNSLKGSVPSDIGGLEKLIRFDISSNEISGPIPSTIESMYSLRKLSMADNNLSGPLPYQVGSVTSLEILELNDNRLSGVIPSTLSELLDLTLLYLQKNSFIGKVPASLASLEKIEKINLSGNKLSGIVPDELCNLRDLVLTSMISDCASGALECEVPKCCTECAPGEA